MDITPAHVLLPILCIVVGIVPKLAALVPGASRLREPLKMQRDAAGTSPRRGLVA
jgi:hypothetical protein